MGRFHTFSTQNLDRWSFEMCQGPHATNRPLLAPSQSPGPRFSPQGCQALPSWAQPQAHGLAWPPPMPREAPDSWGWGCPGPPQPPYSWLGPWDGPWMPGPVRAEPPWGAPASAPWQNVSFHMIQRNSDSVQGNKLTSEKLNVRQCIL